MRDTDFEREANEGWKQLQQELDSPCDDPVVERVVELWRSRSRLGVKKYGTTLAANSGNLIYWLNHLQSELLDAVNYIERLKSELPTPDTFEEIEFEK